nr:hypothetical protein [Deltaproteobacteria bacterium]
MNTARGAEDVSIGVVGTYAGHDVNPVDGRVPRALAAYADAEGVDGAVWIELLDAPLGRLKAARAKVNLEDKELAAALHGRDQADGGRQRGDGRGPPARPSAHQRRE